MGVLRTSILLISVFLEVGKLLAAMAAGSSFLRYDKMSTTIKPPSTSVLLPCWLPGHVGGVVPLSTGLSLGRGAASSNLHNSGVKVTYQLVAPDCSAASATRMLLPDAHGMTELAVAFMWSNIGTLEYPVLAHSAEDEDEDDGLHQTPSSPTRIQGWQTGRRLMDLRRRHTDLPEIPFVGASTLHGGTQFLCHGACHHQKLRMQEVAVSVCTQLR